MLVNIYDKYFQILILFYLGPCKCNGERVNTSFNPFTKSELRADVALMSFNRTY